MTKDIALSRLEWTGGTIGKMLTPKRTLLSSRNAESGYLRIAR